MSSTQPMLPFIFSISILNACSPSQDTVKNPTQTDTSELNPDTQNMMQTDLIAQSPNNEFTDTSEPELSQ